MCGLSLTLGHDSSSEALVAIGAMLHRGTQPPQIRSAGAFTMAHVRLPINGLTEEFDQPYHHKGWTFCFVGEITNFRALAPTARSDVEVVAHLWAERGPECVRAFDGFWAIVAVPPGGGSAQIAVDFLGKKPLYYRADRHAFASEIRALARLGPTSVDPLYFSAVRKWGYHVGRRTWAREIIKLPPGSLTTMDPLGDVTIQEEFDVVVPDQSVKLRAAIKRAVSERVRSSDVPVALLVSGGLDSAIVYKLATGIRDDVTVYHAPNVGDSLDALGVREKTVQVDFKGIDIVDALRWNEGPVDLGSVWPQLALGNAVQESVALSGDGADELFGGYSRALEYDSQASDVWEEIPHYHAPRLDKLMMAGTVELRCPFMSRQVLAGALALPWPQRRDKLWLRHAFEDVLLKRIAYAPKVALKTEVVRADPIGRRERLIGMFQDMMKRGEVA